MLPATALGRGSWKEPLQPGGFLLSHTLWAEGSKSSGREGGHRTGQSLISIFSQYFNINSFSYLSVSKMLYLLDFTFLFFRPETSLGRSNSFECQLLTGMFYHCLSRQQVPTHTPIVYIWFMSCVKSILIFYSHLKSFKTPYK